MNTNQLFHDLCTVLRTHAQLRSKEQRLAPIRDLRTSTLVQAQALLPILERQGKLQEALQAATHSHCVELVMSFPEAPYGTYKSPYRDGIWSSTIDPDLVLALGSRGLDFTPALDTLVTRAFKENAPQLRTWALRYIPQNPGKWTWLSAYKGAALKHHTEFARDLLLEAVTRNPEGARRALERAVDIWEGVAAFALIHAGVEPLPKPSRRTNALLSRLSSHQKITVMRADLRAFLSDPAALRAANTLVKSRGL